MQILMHTYQVSEDDKLNVGDKSRLETMILFLIYNICSFFTKGTITIRNKCFEIIKVVSWGYSSFYPVIWCLELVNYDFCPKKMRGSINLSGLGFFGSQKGFTTVQDSVQVPGSCLNIQ